MITTVKTSGCFSKSRGLRASVPFLPLPHPLPSTFLLSPYFSRGPNEKNSLAQPEFRLLRTGMLAMQARTYFFPSLAKQILIFGGSYGNYHMSSWRTATFSSRPTIGAKFAIDGVRGNLRAGEKPFKAGAFSYKCKIGRTYDQTK